jgi:tetratricopeptide (TPR) repeat protein
MSAETASTADWSRQARRLLADKHIDRLEQLLQQVLAGEPGNHEARQLLGVACSMQGRDSEALAHLSLAVALGDFQPDWLFNLGNVLRSAGRNELAVTAYRRLLSLAPGHAAAWFNLANLLAEMKQDAGAVDAYRRALLADPSYLKAMVNLAGALSRTGDFEGALKVYRQILAGDPGHAGARNNMANLLRDLGRPEEARRILEELAREDPQSPRVQNNLGSALRELGRLDEALAHYRRAVELKQDYPEGQMNYAMALLAAGQWGPGWQRYEARLDPRIQTPVSHLRTALPPWQGEPLRGRRILVHGEQGLGDMLQFCRFVPLLESQGAGVYLLTDRALARLLRHSLGLAGPVLSEGDPVPQGLDFQVSLMSLPLHLGISTEARFLPGPYLRAAAQDMAAWRSTLDGWFGPRHSGGRPRVGLVWAGNPRREMPQASLVDRRRSLPLEQARRLVQDHPGIDWVSLQKGEQQDALGTVRTAAGQLNDFADTAALAQNLDAVVSVDTSVAHLAAGTGRPTLMLSRYDACWRWGLKGRTTPWYDSMTIFRQHRYGDWSGALQDLDRALSDIAQPR